MYQTFITLWQWNQIVSMQALCLLSHELLWLSHVHILNNNVSSLNVWAKTHSAILPRQQILANRSALACVALTPFLDLSGWIFSFLTMVLLQVVSDGSLSFMLASSFKTVLCCPSFLSFFSSLSSSSSFFWGRDSSSPGRMKTYSVVRGDLALVFLLPLLPEC